MTMKKAAILAGIYAASAMNAMNEITNPYDGLPEMRYNGSNSLNEKHNLLKNKRKQGLRQSLHGKLVESSVIRLATNVVAFTMCGLRIPSAQNICYS